MTSHQVKLKTVVSSLTYKDSKPQFWKQATVGCFVQLGCHDQMRNCELLWTRKSSVSKKCMLWNRKDCASSSKTCSSNDKPRFISGFIYLKYLYTNSAPKHLRIWITQPVHIMCTEYFKGLHQCVHEWSFCPWKLQGLLKWGSNLLNLIVQEYSQAIRQAWRMVMHRI